MLFILSTALKKILRDILIVAGLVVMGLSTSTNTMAWLSEKKAVDRWWGVYNNDHGDLVNMAYLDFVQRFVTHRDFSAGRPEYNGPKNTELYLQGDSYTMDIADTAFAAVKNYHFINRKVGLNYHLDTTDNNILILEVTERYTRLHFDSIRMFTEVCDSFIQKKKQRAKYYLASANDKIPFFLKGWGVDALFNRNINQNLEFNIFNYSFITGLFKSKAALNYYLFDRASGDVVISKNHDFLFLKQTVQPYDIYSSYDRIVDNEIDRLVENFNRIYDHYRATGFDEVYLSIIPSPATIMQPEGYNRLIPRIQGSKKLRMKIIDAYGLFTSTKELCYRPGDTHWNNKGLNKWVKLVNDTLVETAKRKK